MSRDRTTARFPHVVIRASAGTGKTFQLTNRFLELACADEPPDHVLAATFARKAAGEILDRALLRLAEATGDEGKLAELAGHLNEPGLDRMQCLRLLKGLIQRMHRLRIGTLDSFFVKLAGSFGLELELPPGWRIVDEITDRELRTEAIQAVLRGEATSELVTLIHLLGKGEVKRSVGQQIAEVVDDLYGLYHETTAEAWQSLPRPKGLTADELTEAVLRLEAFDRFPNKHFVNAHQGAVENARRSDWESFVGKGLAGKILLGETDYHKKPIEAELIDLYRPLIEHARAELVGKVANQTEATWKLLNAFHTAYLQLKQSRRALRFDDITRRLAGGLSEVAVDAMNYRLDAHVAHLLLDEFQDTSLSQWEVMRVFAEEVTAKGLAAEDGASKGKLRSFFCVGDVKQAIYGWRGGVSEVFDAVGDHLEGLNHLPLNQSYRSCRVIIDTVNTVFENLDTCKPLEKHPEVTTAWAERFHTHTTARRKLAGYSCLLTAPRAGEGEKATDATLSFAAAEVARLAAESPDRSIGVLVRRNSAVARLIYELRNKHQVLASEEGGNPLTDSSAVQLLLSVMTLADHPGDTTARFHVANSPLTPVLGLEQHDDDSAARRLSLEVRQALMTQGYGRTVYEWVRALGPSCDQRELNRLLQLVELAYGYESEATVRAHDFVKFVAARKVEDPTAAQVRVMTVHQSKGLQFDIVVLPELDSDLTGQTPRVVVGRKRRVDEIERVCRYVNQKLQPLLPLEFQQMFEAWPNQVVNESLCVLYVAMTRAVHALHMIISPSAENEGTIRTSFAGVLRSTLTEGGKAEPETVLYEHGDPEWFRERRRPDATEGERAVHPPVEPERLAIRLAESPRRRKRGLERQSPSGLEGGTLVNLSRRLRLDNSRALSRGSLLHGWFEQIEWLDEGEPDDAALREAARHFSDLDIESEIAVFRRTLKRTAIREALSRAGYDDPLQLGFPPELCSQLQSGSTRLTAQRERPFALRDDEVLLQGTIDRLVLFHEGERVVAADIIDFKSDAVSADDPAALDTAVEHYRPQIDAYRRATARLTGLESAAISARLLFIEAGVARRC